MADEPAPGRLQEADVRVSALVLVTATMLPRASGSSGIENAAAVGIISVLGARGR